MIRSQTIWISMAGKSAWDTLFEIVYFRPFLDCLKDFSTLESKFSRVFVTARDKWFHKGLQNTQKTQPLKGHRSNVYGIILPRVKIWESEKWTHHIIQLKGACFTVIDHADSRHANPTHGWQNRGSHRYERRLYMKQYNGVLKHQETQAHIFLYLVNKVKLHYKMVPHRKIPTQQFGGKR